MNPLDRRITIVVMDSVGIGAQPDAEDYKSGDANTFHRAAQSQKNFSIPNLQRLGMGNISGVTDVAANEKPLASYGRMRETTGGNDTFAGIWEMAGVVFNGRFESFNPAMPPEVIENLHRHTEVKTLCHQYISGFQVLDLFADEHLASGAPIVYTSDDGVVLVAAHEEMVAPEILHDIAQRMCVFFTDKRITRVIARPFVGTKGKFIRTANRRDFIVPPPTDQNHLFTRLKDAGIDLVLTEHLASLIGREFATEIIPGIKDSAGIMDSIHEYLSRECSGVAMFVVPDFDMSGHRKNPEQYALDLMSFDTRLGEALRLVTRKDIVCVVADHGCDPGLSIRGHTREYVPLLVMNGANKRGQDLGTRASFADLGQTICQLVDAPPITNGVSFAQLL